jgi:GH25 family lysozyme M1 (1,4-beta-N-acetylmuramidase)
MNGIDVSGWQKGINIDAVPADFVITKATQGKSYVNTDCDRVVQACKRLGKCWGFYHYIDGSGVEGEAQFFVNNCKNYFGEGVPCLDWESVQNAAWGNNDYLQRLVARVIELTGVPPLIYASASVYPWTIAKANNCGAWVAQYANNDKTGYQATPWNEGAYSCVIRQYSSNGRLGGYNGALDLNKAYITPEQWGKYVNPKGGNSGGSSTPTTPAIDVDSVAIDVIKGKYGNGDARKQALGANYDRVQQRVNELMKMANKAIRGDYGNGAARRNALGSDYAAVQSVVNYLM